MPRLPIDYSKGLIYKLVCLDPNVKEVYIGSTTNFVERKKNHKNDCNNPNCKQYNYKVYQYIRGFGGFQNWEMVLIEFYPCENNLELGRREDYWKKELKSNLNSISPPMYETKKDYYEGNKEKILEQKKEHYETNKEHINEYQKQYREANKEELKEYIKEYYEANKEKIAEKRSQKYTCECGGRYTHKNKIIHEKSKKHLAYIEQK
jgi:hypothetical protein